MGFRENMKEELTYSRMLVKELTAKSGGTKRSIDSYLLENDSILSAGGGGQNRPGLGRFGGVPGDRTVNKTGEHFWRP